MNTLWALNRHCRAIYIIKNRWEFLFNQLPVMTPRNLQAVVYIERICKRPHTRVSTSIGICWFLSVRHVVDSFTWQNVLAPKRPSSVAKMGYKTNHDLFCTLHVSTPCFYTHSHTGHTAINNVIIVLEQSSLTRHTPFQLGFMQRSAVPMYKS